jgi:monovalent cation:proton antiporter-2 (CPA2) family protein
MAGSLLFQAAMLLAAAAIAAPLGRALRMGAVLGYVAAGILIGPYGLGFVYGGGEVEGILHVAELGIVLLLFLIGLELRPVRLWSMRRSLLGAGSAQVLLSAALIALVAGLAGLSALQAIILGLALALSSTAFVLQILEEKKELNQRHGRLAFSILLFQDLAAIPLLAALPLLSAAQPTEPLAAVLGIAKALAVIAAVVVLGRWVLNQAYRLVAASGVREAMTASALLTVIGVALLMEAAGLSAALGAFIAGALLADSSYRHQMEADIAPFEGLLLGLFFVAIGMALNLGLVLREPALIFALVAGLLAIKSAVLYAVGRWFGLDNRSAVRLALATSQGGEFAFVIFTLAAGNLIGRELAERMTVVVTLSMVATPILLLLHGMMPRTRAAPERQHERPPPADGHVVIAGFGRVGQVVGRVLRAKRIPFTALDNSVSQIDFVNQFGNKIYYGDATRLDILEAAQTGKARAFVIAVDNIDASLKIAEIVRQHFPHVPIYARARNRQHVYRLMDLGLTKMRRETYLSSLALTNDVLEGLGLSASEARQTIDTFRAFDRRRLYENYQDSSDPEKLRARLMKQNEELEELFVQDEQERQDAGRKGAA